MTMLVLQTLLLVAIAYILGCIIGCLLKQWFGSAEAAVTAPVKAVATSARVTPPAPPPPPPVKVAATRKTAPKKAPARKRVSRPKAAPATKDDLKRIKGVGRQNEARLNAIGVSRFEQVAAWTKKEQAEIGERLAFPGRIEREEWVKQAAVLAKGGQTAFSKRVAKGEISSSLGRGSVGDLGAKPAVSAKPKSGKGDNLTLVDGIGNAIEKKLNAIGIHYFEQIAKWNAANQTWIGNEIGFPGRPERENWVKEAKILAAGGTTDHARKVEQGKIATSRKSKSGENS